MACRSSELVVDSRDAEALAACWAGVLGYEVSAAMRTAPVEIGRAPAPAVRHRRSSPPRWPSRPGEVRLHVDVGPTDRDQDAEPARLLALGATRADVGRSGAESWYVLADPEGDEFCLLRRRLDPL